MRDMVRGSHVRAKAAGVPRLVGREPDVVWCRSRTDGGLISGELLWYQYRRHRGEPCRWYQKMPCNSMSYPPPESDARQVTVPHPPGRRKAFPGHAAPGPFPRNPLPGSRSPRAAPLCSPSRGSSVPSRWDPRAPVMAAASPPHPRRPSPARASASHRAPFIRLDLPTRSVHPLIPSYSWLVSRC